LSGLGLTLLGVWFALGVEHVLSAFMFTETIPALLGIMFMGGFLWKRANRYGAAASILMAFSVYYAANYLVTCRTPDGPSTELWPALEHCIACWRSGGLGEFLQSGQWLLVARWSGGPFGCAMLAGFVAFVLVSLVTKPEPPELIDRFFGKMQCCSDEDLPPQTPAATRGHDLILLDLPGWSHAARWRGFFSRYREDVSGFVWAWSSVALLILIAWALMQIGK
jgi:Na+/proline symporter